MFDYLQKFKHKNLAPKNRGEVNRGTTLITGKSRHLGCSVTGASRPGPPGQLRSGTAAAMRRDLPANDPLSVRRSAVSSPSTLSCDEKSVPPPANKVNRFLPAFFSKTYISCRSIPVVVDLLKNCRPPRRAGGRGIDSLTGSCSGQPCRPPGRHWGASAGWRRGPGG